MLKKPNVHCLLILAHLNPGSTLLWVTICLNYIPDHVQLLVRALNTGLQQGFLGQGKDGGGRGKVWRLAYP